MRRRCLRPAKWYSRNKVEQNGGGFSERHGSAFDTQPAAGNQHIAYARHQDSQRERRKAEKAESGESGVSYGAIHYQVWRSGYNDGAKTSGRQHRRIRRPFHLPPAL